jgi:hypothetical protein
MGIELRKMKYLISTTNTKPIEGEKKLVSERERIEGSRECVIEEGKKKKEKMWGERKYCLMN